MTPEQLGKLREMFPVCQSSRTGKFGWRRVNGGINLNSCSFRTEADAEADRDEVLTDPGRWDDQIRGMARPVLSLFAAKLRSLREAAGLSAPQLAEKAGISRQAVNYYEAGERAPTWDAAQALAAALGVPTDAFRTK